MVGAPVSYQLQPPPAAGTKYAPPPSQMYSTPSAPISVLLPYDGLAPPASAPYPAPNMNPPAPFNTGYLYSDFQQNYPTVSSATAPPPFPPYPPYTQPATYPIPAYLSPQPTPSYNAQFPSGYPTVGAGNYAHNPQALPYGAYWSPPPAGTGSHPPRY